ncbi:acetylxylan esterase [Actinoplanes sp. NPDC049596]|uniref:acetylxylan esterase n=1 Tax=unclassified Actinoplanes TaxID=2626549 RepID=UPI003428D56F
MPFFDLPAEELRGYAPALSEPDDLDAFWASTLETARTYDVDVRATAAATPLRLIETWDVSFLGYGGQPVKAWLHLPAGAPQPPPVVVEYIGYGGGRGLVHEHVGWTLAGYAHLVVDNRGQGWGAEADATPDDDPETGTSGPAFVTRGILDPATYYYRRLFTDGVRAVDAVRGLPLVDGSRVVVSGTSQGGGIAIAVAALSAGLAGAMVDVPFLCHFERAVGLTDSAPYQEIVSYLRSNRGHAAAAYSTLRYFDGAILASRATVPALFSVGLMDPVCPPSTVFAAFNRWGSADRSIVEYPFNMHEGGEAFQRGRQYAWLAERLGVRYK